MAPTASLEGKKCTDLCGAAQRFERAKRYGDDASASKGQSTATLAHELIADAGARKDRKGDASKEACLVLTI